MRPATKGSRGDARLATKERGRGLLQKGAGGDQKPVIKFVWPYGSQERMPGRSVCSHPVSQTSSECQSGVIRMISGTLSLLILDKHMPIRQKGERHSPLYCSNLEQGHLLLMHLGLASNCSMSTRVPSSDGDDHIKMVRANSYQSLVNICGKHHGVPYQEFLSTDPPISAVHLLMDGSM